MLVLGLTLAVLAAVVPEAAAHPGHGPGRGGGVGSTACDATSRFLEAQGWWTRTPGRQGPHEGHIHVGACIPTGVLSRPTDMDIRLVMHDNPGRFEYITVVTKGKGYEHKVARLRRGGVTSPNGTREEWFEARLDPRDFKHSGNQELRLRAFVRSPAGNSFLASLTVPVQVDNGRPRLDWTREPWLRGKGMYSAGRPVRNKPYCDASLVSDLPSAPVSGVWQPRVLFVDHPTGHNDNAPTRHLVSIDSDAHASPPDPGTVVIDGTGPLPRTGMTPVTLRIDTTRLSNGRHRLHLKTECADALLGATQAGAVAFEFKVRN
jgi:hypothetical protein